MKKLLYISAILSMSMFAGSCGFTGEPSSANDTDSLALDSLNVEELKFTTNKVTFSDSIEVNGVMIHYDIDLDVPATGPHQLVQAVKQWLNQVLGGSYSEEPNFDDDMLRYYSMEYFDDKSDMASDAAMPDFAFTLSATVKESNDRFVSYEVEGYDYTGGAHGMPIEYGATFVMADGSQLGWEMFADSTDLYPLFKHYVATYFEVDNDSSVNELLFEDAARNFPLPTQSPWLVADGVKFCYTAYEIAPYAAGRPSAVIPTDKAKKYLTKVALALLQAK